MQALGGSLVAISPVLPQYSREMKALQKLAFPILHDRHNQVARQFRLVFRLPDDLRQAYLGIGHDLEKYNGDDSWELPIPASYVIGRDGIVRYASADPDYTHRPEPGDILQALRLS